VQVRKREWTKQLHMDIREHKEMPFLPCVIHRTNEKRAAFLSSLLFYLIFSFLVLLDTGGFLLVFCVVSNDLTLVIIG
jgi:hypothetical protein